MMKSVPVRNRRCRQREDEYCIGETLRNTTPGGSDRRGRRVECCSTLPSARHPRSHHDRPQRAHVIVIVSLQLFDRRGVRRFKARRVCVLTEYKGQGILIKLSE